MYPRSRSSLIALSVWVGSLAGVAPAAAQSSGIDTTRFDWTVRPQDNLYRYVNGRWIERNEIPPYMSSWSAGNELQIRVYEAARQLLESPTVSRDARDADRRKLADVYQSYMNEQAIESAGIAPLRAELARISMIRSSADAAAVLAHFMRLSLTAPLSISVHPDDREHMKQMVDLEQSGLGLPDRDYYSSDEPRFQDIRAKYREHIARTLALAGDRASTDDAAAVLALETRLAAEQWTGVQNRDPVKTYNRVALSALDSLAPGLHWTRVVAELGLPGKASYVNVSQPSYFGALGRLVQDTPPSVWRAYFRWHLLDSFSPFLSKAYDDERMAFSQAIGGPTITRPRWLRAVGFVDDRMGGVLGRLYVERYFPPAARAHGDTLVQNLIAAFRQHIAALEWMNPDTKQEAFAKLTALRVKLGYPNRWQDYAPLHTSPTDLIGNLLRLKALRYARQLDRLNTPIDREEWGMSVLAVNGSYSALRNEITLPAALMQPPYFQSTADDAANYGGLGWFIAHEVGHAFDNRGSQYDSHGNLRDWWAKDDHAQFDARRRAFIEQYSRYQPVPSMFINGELTVGENIADNLGLTIAYEAYHRSLGSRTPPVLDGLTGDQRFYASFAAIWAGRSREANLIQGLKTDTHSPGDFRVWGALVNQDPFYAAFNVHEGDKMYVPPAQRVRIW